MGLVKGRPIDVGLRIKDNDIRKVPRLQVAALGEPEDIGRQTAGAAESVLQRDDFLGDGIAADFARKATITPGVRYGVARYLGAAVAGGGHEILLHDQAD